MFYQRYNFDKKLRHEVVIDRKFMFCHVEHFVMTMRKQKVDPRCVSARHMLHFHLKDATMVRMARMVRMAISRLETSSQSCLMPSFINMIYGLAFAE